MIRVPEVHGKKATRVELRCPDASSNPYFVFSAMLAAGLDGIEQNLKAPEPVEENVFITQDGLLFIPQTINIDETLSQFQALDQQPQPESQNLAPVNGSDQTPQE